MVAFVHAGKMGGKGELDPTHGQHRFVSDRENGNPENNYEL